MKTIKLSLLLSGLFCPGYHLYGQPGEESEICTAMGIEDKMEDCVHCPNGPLLKRTNNVNLFVTIT